MFRTGERLVLHGALSEVHQGLLGGVEFDTCGKGRAEQ
jgi:hypothetical protein